MSDEDLKQVTGGGILYTGYMQGYDPGTWDIINDRTGDVVGRVSAGTRKLGGYETAQAEARRIGVGENQLLIQQVLMLREKR